MSCDTAQEMWVKLETEYGEASSEIAPRLWTKFYGCKFQRGQSLTAFLTELEQTVSRLRSLNVVIEDNQIIAKILLTIPAELQIFEVTWDITPGADKTLKNFTSRLIKLHKIIKMRKDEEKEEFSDAAFLGKNNNARAEPSLPDPREEAMPAQELRGQNKGKGGAHSSRQPPGGKRECWECGDTSHVKAQCRHYKRRREKEEEEEAYRKRRRHDDHDRRERVSDGLIVYLLTFQLSQELFSIPFIRPCVGLVQGFAALRML